MLSNLFIINKLHMLLIPAILTTSLAGTALFVGAYSVAMVLAFYAIITYLCAFDKISMKAFILIWIVALITTNYVERNYMSSSYNQKP